MLRAHQYLQVVLILYVDMCEEHFSASHEFSMEAMGLKKYQEHQIW